MASTIATGVVGSHGASDHPRPVNVAVVSSHPPTSCGLATFSSALGRGLRAAGVGSVGVVRCLQGDESIGTGGGGESNPLLWDPRVEDSIGGVARFLNQFDAVFLQHEYGIYGPNDGEVVLELLDAVYVPVIPTLHTVPLKASERQRRILEGVTARAAATIVMTEAARARLIALFDVDPSRIVTIPHGATRPPATAPPTRGATYCLTWGLLGPGKGIEWVLDALALPPLRDSGVVYRVMGRTHPKVAAREGDAYLAMLRQRADQLGVADRVVFDETYHSLDTLLALVASARLVILPYDSDDQITSGVLVDAITAGVPVVATDFPHARELLERGAGTVVPHRDPAALSTAIHEMFTDDAVRATMAREAAVLGRGHEWASVAAEYLRVAGGVLGFDRPARTTVEASS